MLKFKHKNCDQIFTVEHQDFIVEGKLMEGVGPLRLFMSEGDGSKSEFNIDEHTCENTCTLGYLGDLLKVLASEMEDRDTWNFSDSGDELLHLIAYAIGRLAVEAQISINARPPLQPKEVYDAG